MDQALTPQPRIPSQGVFRTSRRAFADAEDRAWPMTPQEVDTGVRKKLWSLSLNIVF
jgi:hypothetical protein